MAKEKASVREEAAETHESEPLSAIIARQRARSEELRWLLEPASAGETNLHIEVPDANAPLSPQFRKAIERLIVDLGIADVSARINKCTPKGDCVVLKWSTCYAFVSCKIKETPPPTV